MQHSTRTDIADTTRGVMGEKGKERWIMDGFGGILFGGWVSLRGAESSGIAMLFSSCILYLHWEKVLG
jgi:hypothetical protein